MKKKNVLPIYVVDDDDHYRSSVLALLGSEGMSVEAYVRGEEFLSALPGLPPGVLLLDLNMPGVSGFQVLEDLNSGGHNFRTVVVTAHDEHGLESRLAGLGVLKVLRKPCPPKDLIATVWANAAGPHALEPLPA